MEANLGLESARDIGRKKTTRDNMCLHVVYPEDWEEHSDFDKIFLDADVVGVGFLVLFRTLSEILNRLLDEPWSDGAVFTICVKSVSVKSSSKFRQKSDYKPDFGSKLWILTWEGGWDFWLTLFNVQLTVLMQHRQCVAYFCLFQCWMTDIICPIWLML